MLIDPKLLVHAFGEIEKSGVLVRKLTLGVGARLPDYLIWDDDTLWGAQIERTPRWTRIVAVTSAAGKSLYYRLPPEMEKPAG